MELEQAILALGALAQDTRLDVFRRLVQHEPDGIAAGELARLVAVPQNTMSSHLAILARAGLVRPERKGRSIVYRADLARLGGVVAFLMEDCCGGQAGLCTPAVGEAAVRKRAPIRQPS